MLHVAIVKEKIFNTFSVIFCVTKDFLSFPFHVVELTAPNSQFATLWAPRTLKGNVHCGTPAGSPHDQYC